MRVWLLFCVWVDFLLTSGNVFFFLSLAFSFVPSVGGVSVSSRSQSSLILATFARKGPYSSKLI